MKRWSIAVAAAGFLAVCVAIPAQAAEWCMHDPAINIRTTPGDSFTVYVTEGVQGLQHEPALASARATYRTRTASKSSVVVVIYDYIPSDASGTFATMMVVSSKPFGGGVVYGSAYGASGTPMSVTFWVNPEKIKG
jgi:hypothetical protein